MSSRERNDVDSPWYIAIRDWLRIDVFNREFPDHDDYWDCNWLNARWRVHNDISRAEWSGPYIRTDELERLAELVPELRVGKVETVRLAPTEGWWDLEVSKSGELGHFDLRVVVSALNASPGRFRSHHTFEFIVEHADLQLAEAQLQSVLQEFPVIGKP